MNREIDTSDFQKRINQAVGKVAKKITKMVIHYDDDSTIILEDGGKVGRTGNWETHCVLCGEKSETTICSDECDNEAFEILAQMREEEYLNDLLYDKMRDNL